MEETIGRRRVLRGAGAAAAGGVAVTTIGLASPALADGGGGRGRLAGSWLVRRQDDGDPNVVRAVLSFAEGGVFISHDISPAGPPFTGSWEKREDHGFRAEFWSGFPGETGPGSPGDTIRVRARGRVEDGVISGTYRFRVFGPDGDEVFAGTGSFRGRRIDP